MTPAASVFTGELGLIGLFDLGQLLMFNRATGVLQVETDDRKGYLYFAEGRLVNAVDDALAEGESAACRIFGWSTGRFEFRPEAASGPTTIQGGTDAVMLEAARRLDEAHAEAGDSAVPGGQVDRVREHQAAMEALRDAFRLATGEVRDAGEPGASEVPAARLFDLAEPGDALLYRPGQPAQQRLRGVWTQAEGPALTAAAYEELRLRLLQACTATSAITSGAHATRRIALADGRSVALEFVNEGPDESLWLRPVDLPAPDPGQLSGDRRRLEEMLDRAPAWLLVGATTLCASRRLLHALIAWIARERGATVLIASNDETFRHREYASPVLRVSPGELRAALRTVRPDILVFDPGDTGFEFALSDLDGIPHVMAGVVAADVSGLLPRWSLRVGGRDPLITRMILSSTAVGVAWVGDLEIGEPGLPFTARWLTPEERSSWLEPTQVATQPRPAPRPSRVG